VPTDGSVGHVAEGRVPGRRADPGGGSIRPGAGSQADRDPRRRPGMWPGV